MGKWKNNCYIINSKRHCFSHVSLCKGYINGHARGSAEDYEDHHWDYGFGLGKMKNLGVTIVVVCPLKLARIIIYPGFLCQNIRKSRLKISYFCKMIALYIILKQVPTVVMVKLWQLIFCFEIYDWSKLRFFPHFNTKSFVYGMYVDLDVICTRFKHFRWSGWNFPVYKYFLRFSINLYGYKSTISYIRVVEMSVLGINCSNVEKDFKTTDWLFSMRSWDVQEENENHGKLNSEWRCIV